MIVNRNVENYESRSNEMECLKFMKKKIIIILSIVFCLVIGVVVYAATSVPINAFIVNCEIVLDGHTITDNLEYPIISYNDHAYIAIRDIAKELNKDILWDDVQGKDFRGIIEMRNKDYNRDPVIKDEETATLIGQAVIRQFFPDKVSDETVYEFVIMETDLSSFTKTTFIIEARFDGDKDGHCDASVNIDSLTGEVNNVYDYTGEQSVRVYPYPAQ